MIQYTEAEEATIKNVAAAKIKLLTEGVASWKQEFDEVSDAVGPLTGCMKNDFVVLVEELKKKEKYSKWHQDTYDSQDALWNTAESVVKNHYDRITEKYNSIMDPASQTKGTLILSPSLILPKYAVDHDIHRMPGGYGDVSFHSGALYTVAADAFFRGYQSGYVGHFAIEILKRKFPEFVPTKLLDIGCAAGNSTWVWCEQYPMAEVHGADFGAGLLKYAHIEAEARGVVAHFHQMNCEDMSKFEDGSFDLVVSHIIFHETSPEAIVKILKECMRVLRPGGVMLHIDVCNQDWHYSERSMQFLQHWQTFYNEEPFWSDYAMIKVFFLDEVLMNFKCFLSIP